jgi:acyl-coenzyme A synthetase/AMP-(fatty) acid ligase
MSNNLLLTPCPKPCCIAERERVTASNVASTMITLMVNSPLMPVLDLSSLRVLSCGGSPLPPSNVRTALAAFGCEFFISYGG